MFFRYAVVLLGICFSMQAKAVDTRVARPLGAPKGLVVIAPAKAYLMEERLFTQLSDHLVQQGFVAVRFNWSPDTLQDPAFELQRAARDIKEVLQTAQKHFGIYADRTVLVSKSFSTKALAPSLVLAHTHILLTPNCSPEAPFQKTYGTILSHNELSLRMIISSEDPYCRVDEIRQTLRVLAKSPLLTTTHGDHNFVVTDPSSHIASFYYQDQVVKNVVDSLKGIR